MLSPENCCEDCGKPLDLNDFDGLCWDCLQAGFDLEEEEGDFR